MFRQCFLLIFVAVAVLATVADGLAETQYVSDRLIVSLRDVPQDQYTSLTTLASDAPVELLGEEGRFKHVRTEEGLEGYIPAQYLTDETPKPIIIKRLQSEVDRYKQQVAALKAQLREEKGGLAETLESEQAKAQKSQKDLEEVRQRLASAQKELTATRENYAQLQKDAKNVVKIAQERNQLNETIGNLQEQLAMLEQENNTLLRTGVIKWFLAGGGVFFIGWLVGKISRKKKRGF
jgi:SH3 domain protein